MTDAFIDYVVQLHAEKDAVYGNSWKRRGEAVAILANIARKVDRLGVAGAGDTSADTAVDLLVYLCKYRLWIHDELGELAPRGFVEREHLGDGPAPVEKMLRLMTHQHFIIIEALIQYEKDLFENLLTAVAEDMPRHFLVDLMISYAQPLARALWEQEQTPAWVDGLVE